MSPDPEIKYVTWRGGRPRFVPSPSMRKDGFDGQDLKNDDGSWMTAGQALEWSRAFEQHLKAARRAAGKKPKKKASPALPVPRARYYPVSQLFEDWLKACYVKVDLGDLAKKTVDEYRYKVRAIEKYEPAIYNSEVLALDPDICEGVYDNLRLKAGLPTAVGCLRVLGIAIEWGRKKKKDYLGTMTGNPAHGLAMVTPQPRLRVGSIEEIDHLVATADAMGWHEIGDAIVFAVWTGQRQADRLLYVNESETNGRMVFRQQKTGAIVSLKRAPALKLRLDAAKIRRAEKRIKTDFVVYNERGNAPFQASFYSHMILDIRKAAAAGLPDALGRPTVKPMPSLMTLTDQDFRDTAVTWLARAGATIAEICAITGHSFKTATEILKHYLALDEEMADNGMDKLTIWHAKERA
ncbi:hypothetical protein [Rhizobium sp. ICMP 5592]|uniref:hypothetical protein n=1 Tax=Rhizobium sp. ICMP 5592 TaxID=2292445 RepID=UPI0012951CCB|nr:hypothetical protein [Rhizobium sp. ICMP 5592]MQB43355.1 hypothetical protein [Rhizobium sp. ICMP 5592]